MDENVKAEFHKVQPHFQQDGDWQQDANPVEEEMAQGITCTPDDLMMDAMSAVCGAMDLILDVAIAKDPDAMYAIELARTVDMMAMTMTHMYNAMTAGDTLDKLRAMKAIEERNDKSIREWSDKHEQGGSGI